MASWLSNPSRIGHRVEAAHGLIFQHAPREDAWTQRDQVILLVKTWAGLEPMDGGNVHRGRVGRIEANEAELRVGQIQAMPERRVQHLLKVVELGNLQRQLIERLQLLAALLRLEVQQIRRKGCRHRCGSRCFALAYHANGPVASRVTYPGARDPSIP